MGDHFAILVNKLITESTLHDAIENRNGLNRTIFMLDEAPEMDSKLQRNSVADDFSPRKIFECRICQDEDLDSHMETPCSCRGSLKYAHRKCVQRWCNEKGDTTCEICHQQFKPGYTTASPLVLYRHIPLNFRRNWEINRRVLSNSQFVRMIPAAVQNVNSHNDGSHSRNLRCLAVAIVFMVLLILRHTLPIIINGLDCCFPLLSLIVLRILGFTLLFYIILLALVGLRHQHLNGLLDGSTVALPQERLDLQESSHVIRAG